MACLVFDDTGFPKQGTASVGVTRQYSGTLGKVGNCQVAVTCCYTDLRASWPVAVRLYLPKTWAGDPSGGSRPGCRRRSRFRPSPRSRWRSSIKPGPGVPHRCVVADADYGDNPNFLAGLEARQEPYVVAVRTDFPVSIGHMASTPIWPADALLQSVPRWQWRTIRWRRGTKGWLRKKFVAVRCWRVTSDGNRHAGWLVGERAPQGPPEERKYFWSNLSPETPLEVLAGYAHRRHAIERFHEEAKGELGWDQYQGRLWLGFHRHAVTVMLAYSFLVWLEWRQRRRTKRPGRPRDPFPPSADAPAPDPAGGASGGGPVAATPSRALVGDNR